MSPSLLISLVYLCSDISYRLWRAGLLIRQDLAVKNSAKLHNKSRQTKPVIKLAIFVPENGDITGLKSTVDSFTANNYKKKKIEIYVAYGCRQTSTIKEYSLGLKNPNIRFIFKRKPVNKSKVMRQAYRGQAHDLGFMIDSGDILNTDTFSRVANFWLCSGKPEKIIINAEPINDGSLPALLAFTLEPSQRSTSVIVGKKASGSKAETTEMPQPTYKKKCSFTELYKELPISKPYQLFFGLAPYGLAWFALVALNYQQATPLLMLLFACLFTILNNALSKSGNLKTKVLVFVVAPALVLPYITFGLVITYKMIKLCLRFLSKIHQSPRKQHQTFTA